MSRDPRPPGVWFIEMAVVGTCNKTLPRRRTDREGKAWNTGVMDVPWIQGVIAPFFPIIPPFQYSIIPPKDVNVWFCDSLIVT